MSSIHACGDEASAHEISSITSLPIDCLRSICDISSDAALLSLTMTCKGLQTVADEPDQWKRRALKEVAGSKISEAFVDNCMGPKTLYLGLLREHGHILTSLWRALDAPYGALIVPMLQVDGSGLPCIDLISVIVHKLRGKVEGRKVFRISLGSPSPRSSPPQAEQANRGLGYWISRKVQSTVTSLTKMALPSSPSSSPPPSPPTNSKSETSTGFCFNHPESVGNHPIRHPATVKIVEVDGRAFIAARCRKRSCRHTDFEPMLRYTGYLSDDTKGFSPLVDLPSVASDSFARLGLEVEEPDEMEHRAHFRHITHFLRFLDQHPNQKKCHAALPPSLISQEGKTIYYEKLEIGTGHPLAGLWRGTYSSHGLEIVNFSLRTRGADLPWPEPRTDVEDEALPILVAMKITGDSNVPAGQISIVVDLSARTNRPTSFRPGVKFALGEGYFCDLPLDALSRLTVDSSYEARGHIAMPNYGNDSWSDAELVTFRDSPDALGLIWHDLRSFSLFSRLQISI